MSSASNSLQGCSYLFSVPQDSLWCLDALREKFCGVCVAPSVKHKLHFYTSDI